MFNARRDRRSKEECVDPYFGGIGGERYAAAAAPYYAYVARLIAHGHPWQIVTVELTPPDAKSVRVLRLIGQMRRDSGVFLILEAATTGVQLMHSLPQASAMLNGETDPLTPWERYSRFLEAGGRFVLEVCAVLLTVGAAKTLRFSDRKMPTVQTVGV